MESIRKTLAWILVFCMILCLLPSVAVPANAETDGETVVINPMDYGADPTGATDSAEAIWAALEAAKAFEEQGKHVTVKFPKGEYHIYKDKSQTREYHTSNTNSIENPMKTIGILIEDHFNLTLDGSGSLFMMHGNMMALAVVMSENIVLKDFAWDFSVPTVTEMTVTASGSNYTEYYIPETFPYSISGGTITWSSDLSPYTGQPYWTAVGNHNTYAIVTYHPDDEMARNMGTDVSPFTNATGIEDRGNNVIRITYSAKNGSQQQHHRPGTIFALCGNAHRETAGAFTWESKNVLVQDVNVHFMHGFGWLIQMSENVTYRSCNLMPRENSGHITVSFADGLHASGAKGTIIVENCNFSNTHDDPINFHGTFTRVERRIDDHTLELRYIHNQQGGFPQYHVGDQIAFYTRDTLESSDNETLYTVSKVISNPGQNGNDLRTMVIEFAQTLPDFLTQTVSNGSARYVAENVTYAPAVIIKGNTFKNTATRGILCTTRQPVVIEDNIFLNMSMATIFLSNDSGDWYESGPIRDMVIRNNTFYIKTIGDTYWDYKSAVYVHPVTYGNGLPSYENPIHKNITIEGNTFHMSDDTVVKAESVENLTIRNNTILRTDPEFTIAISSGISGSLAVGQTASLVTDVTGTTIIGDNNKNLADTTSRQYDNVFEFKACKNVVIEGNTYDDGMKNYAVYSDMPENYIKNADKEIRLVTDANLAADAPISDLIYVSTDPDVVCVDPAGKVTAVAAGTADVYAYYVWNSTVVKSNVLTFTVGSDSTGADVTSDSESRMSSVLNSDFSITRPDNDKYAFNGNGVTITMQAGDVFDHWHDNLKNLFLYDNFDRNDVRTVIKVEGLPIKESNQWDTASFFLYTDDDNYLSIGKKSHFDGFVAVSETSDKGTEHGGNQNHNSVSTAYLGITNTGTGTVTLDYSLDGVTWTKGFELSSSMLSNDYRIGFSCWETNARGRQVTFSDFRVGRASEVTYGQLMQQPAISMQSTGELTLSGLYLNGVSIPADSLTAFELTLPADLNKVEIQAYLGEDGTTTVAAGSNVREIRSNGRTTLDVTGVHTVTVTHSVKDREDQIYTIQLSRAQSNETRIQGIQIPELGFDVSDLTAATWTSRSTKDSATVKVLCDDSIGRVEVCYNNYRKPITMTKTSEGYEGRIAFETGLNSYYITVVAKDGITVRKYNVNIIYTPDSVAQVFGLTVNGNPVKEFASNIHDYLLTLEETDTINVSASSGQKLRLRIDNTYVMEETGKTSLEVTNLAGGSHEICVVAVADDGIVRTAYRIDVVIPYAENVELYTFNVDNMSVLPEIEEGGDVTVFVDGDTAELRIVAKDNGALIKVGATEPVPGSYNGTVILTDGKTDVTVTVTARDGITSKTYTLILDKRMDPNDSTRDIPLGVLIPTAGNSQSNEGPERVIDEDEGTLWHTSWSGVSRDKHWIQFELKEDYTVDGLRYKPRTQGGENGLILAYEIQVSSDGTNFKTVASGSWERNTNWKGAEFEAVNTKYVRLISVNSVTDQSAIFSSAAEIRLTGEKYNPIPKITDVVADPDQLTCLGGQVIVTVTGTNLISGMEVSINGVSATTSGNDTAQSAVLTIPANSEENPITCIVTVVGTDKTATVTVGSHVCTEGSHNCGYCGEKVTECGDKEPKDHECDVCGEAVGKHEDTDKDHDCEYGCSETIGSCEDKDNNGKCDYGCGKEFEVEPEPTEPKPKEPPATEPKPTEPKPTEPKPTEPKPTEPVPTEPEATEPETPKTEGVTRLAGENRLVTSELIANQLKEKMGVEKFQNIIVASGGTFADALPGSYLAAVKNAPILLTLAKQKYIDQTANYIKANLVEGGTVYILGGESAVPSSMETALTGINVKRVAGADRFGTNLAILKEAGVKRGSEILVCTAKEFADSLSAAATGKPILLVYKKITDEQKAYLGTLSGNTFCVVGGSTAVPDNIIAEICNYGSVSRLAGKDRLDTSILVAKKYFPDATTSVVAYGWDFPDGLCGGSLAYATKSPLILAHSKEKLFQFTSDYTVEAGLKAGFVLGGDKLVTDDATRAIFSMDDSVTIHIQN